jgi:hypothetical protein
MHRGFKRGSRLALAHPCLKVRKDLDPAHVRRIEAWCERGRAEWNAFAAAREERERRAKAGESAPAPGEEEG